MTEKVNKLEVLRTELKQLSESAPVGSHRIVSKKLYISPEYLYQIRRGENATTDNDKNRKLVTKAVKEYRKIINNHIKKMSSL